MDVVQANSEQAVVEAIAAASEAKRPIEIVGRGSKCGFGPLIEAQTRLVLDGLSGITSYDPSELVLTAHAGTPLSLIAECLAEHDQTLGFEPRDLSSLFGTRTGQSLGGLVASGLAGPRRCVAGGIRDHVLGIRAVNGTGQLFKAGGKVVKNVTGYDLCKLLTGSFGTLAALTEITVKVVPAPETEVTLVLCGPHADRAVSVMSEALGSGATPSGAAWLPAALSARSTLAPRTTKAVTCLRLEGFEPSVRARCEHLRRRLEGTGDITILESTSSSSLWREIRDVTPLAHAVNPLVWKVSVRPSDAPQTLERLTALGAHAAYLDWGGALIWLSMPSDTPDRIHQVRALLPADAHATLVVASAEIRETIPAFQPLPAAVRGLEARVKANFDPHDILNRRHTSAIHSET